ncbi:MAG: alpha/beta hydrolase family protein, partial [Gemmatimonadales bacterium]
VYAPRSGPAPPGKRRPAIVFVHGAGIMQNVLDGWTYYSRNFMFHTLLVERGFLVFEVDYRGSTGYGRDFRAGVMGHLGGRDLEDELAGVDYLRGRGDVDPERIGIYGGSYGGFMALMGLFQHPDVYASGAALRFVADWRSYHRGNPVYCRQRLGRPEDNPEAYRRSSPIEFASGLAGPLLLLHGVLDSNVPFQDCVRLVDALVAAGKKPELMIYPREDHGFTEAASWIDQYDRILEFFERTLMAPRDGA